MIKLRRVTRFGIPLTLVGALAFGCATTRPIGQQLDDNNLSLAVGRQLSADPQIDRYRIDVDTLDGVVTLRGSVTNAEQREDAERITQATKGVVDVVNDLDIELEPRTAAVKFEDAWIASMINSKIAFDPEVRSRNVDVDVIEGVVTLSGIVETKVARTEAEDLAFSVDGVVQVVNDIVISND
jgi:hyperosmotically inducible protein